MNNSEHYGETQVRNFYNHAVIAFALAAADECGMLDLLHRVGSCAVADLRLQSQEAASLASDVMRLLARARVLKETTPAGHFEPGPVFDAAFRNKGYFTWLLAASGPVLCAAGKVLSGGLSHQALPPRDRALIGKSSADFGAWNLDPVLMGLPELQNAQCIVDLGCGNGSRLVSLVQRTGARGIGVDVSAQAIAQAASYIRALPEVEAVSLVRGDVRSLGAHRDLLKQVDTAIMALMAHDLWPEEIFLATMAHWRECMPNCRTVVICETYRDPDAESSLLGASPFPTLGYEYLHSAMGQYIPTREEWIRTFNASPWPYRRSVGIEMPADTDVFVCTRG